MSSNPLRMIVDAIAAIVLFASLALVFAVDRQTQVALAPPIDPTPVEPEALLPPPPPPPPPELPPPPDPEPPPPPPPPPTIALVDSGPPIDPTPRIAVNFRQQKSFLGLIRQTGATFGVVTTTGNPDDRSDDGKQLTFGPAGETNSTRVHVDGSTPLFDTDNVQVADGHYEAVWQHGRVQVKQTVKLIAGDISRRMDVVRTTYEMQNLDSSDHRVGLMAMIDTLIGGNDGVPFIVPGSKGIVTSAITYRGADVPDFVRALERGNLTDPGVIVNIGLRSGEGEPPTEVVLSHWPGGGADWNYNRNYSLGGDSAIGLFYEPRNLPPGETRSVSYTYGLGTISSTQSKNAKLSLTAGGPFQAGGKFWLVALVQNPKLGQSVQVSLPAGLSLAPDEKPIKTVATGGEFAQLSWLVQIAADCPTEAELKGTLSPEGVDERQKIVVRPVQARLTLSTPDAVQCGAAFWTTALVQNPKVGQAVELALPAGLSLAADEQPSKRVTADSSRQQFSWLVQVGPSSKGEVEIKARLTPDGVEQQRLVGVQPIVSRLSVNATRPVQGGKPFWVSALVQHPKSGQTAELLLPNGFKLASTETAVKTVPTDKGYVQVVWLVYADSRQSGKAELRVELLPGKLTGSCEVDVAPGNLFR